MDLSDPPKWLSNYPPLPELAPSELDRLSKETDEGFGFSLQGSVGLRGKYHQIFDHPSNFPPWLFDNGPTRKEADEQSPVDAKPASKYPPFWYEELQADDEKVVANVKEPSRRSRNAKARKIHESGSTTSFVSKNGGAFNYNYNLFSRDDSNSRPAEPKVSVDARNKARSRVLEKRNREGKGVKGVHYETYGELPNYPKSSEVIPVDVSLEGICKNYPNHLFGVHLDPFIQRKWTGLDIYKLLPHDVVNGLADQGIMSSDHKNRANFLTKRLDRRMEDLGADGIKTLIEQPKVRKCLENGTEVVGHSKLRGLYENKIAQAKRTFKNRAEAMEKGKKQAKLAREESTKYESGLDTDKAEAQVQNGAGNNAQPLSSLQSVDNPYLESALLRNSSNPDLPTSGLLPATGSEYYARLPDLSQNTFPSAVPLTSTGDVLYPAFTDAFTEGQALDNFQNPFFFPGTGVSGSDLAQLDSHQSTPWAQNANISQAYHPENAYQNASQQTQQFSNGLDPALSFDDGNSAGHQDFNYLNARPRTIAQGQFTQLIDSRAAEDDYSTRPQFGNTNAHQNTLINLDYTAWDNRYPPQLSNDEAGYTAVTGLLEGHFTSSNPDCDQTLHRAFAGAGKHS